MCDLTEKCVQLEKSIEKCGQRDTYNDLEIKLFSNDKDKIVQPINAEKNRIPRINSSTIIVGASGSGKSLVLANLVLNQSMLKGCFDAKILISPSAKSDDFQRKLQADHIITDLNDEALPFLDALFQLQSSYIEKHGAKCAPKVLVVLDDCVANTKFISSKQLRKCFFQARHHNLTVFLLSQSYKVIQRSLRLQAMNVIFFRSSLSESQRVSEEFCPPGYTIKDFTRVIEEITAEKHSFLYICKTAPIDKRFRQNFTKIWEI